MREVKQKIFCQLPMCVRSFLLQRSAGEHKTGFVLYVVFRKCAAALGSGVFFLVF